MAGDGFPGRSLPSLGERSSIRAMIRTAGISQIAQCFVAALRYERQRYLWPLSDLTAPAATLFLTSTFSKLLLHEVTFCHPSLYLLLKQRPSNIFSCNLWVLFSKKQSGVCQLCFLSSTYFFFLLVSFRRFFSYVLWAIHTSLQSSFSSFAHSCDLLLLIKPFCFWG